MDDWVHHVTTGHDDSSQAVERDGRHYRWIGVSVAKQLPSRHLVDCRKQNDSMVCHKGIMFWILHVGNEKGTCVEGYDGN